MSQKHLLRFIKKKLKSEPQMVFFSFFVLLVKRICISVNDLWLLGCDTSRWQRSDSRASVWIVTSHWYVIVCHLFDWLLFKFVCLFVCFKAYDLNANTLDVHADTTVCFLILCFFGINVYFRFDEFQNFQMFHRFDKFNLKYNPCGQVQI